MEVRPSAGETYADLVGSVGGVLTTHNPWHAAPWELLLATEIDNPINRHIGFWKRYGANLRVNADAVEAARFGDGQITRAAAAPIDGVARFRAALSDDFRTRFHLTVVLPTTAGTQIVTAALESVFNVPRAAGYGFQRGLAGAVAAAGCCLMVKSETARHMPCLLFLGKEDHVTTIQSALRAYR